MLLSTIKRTDIAPEALPHVLTALENEIARLYAIAEKCDDEWPEDFDQNDISVYRSVLRALDEGGPGVLPRGKPSAAATMLIDAYLRENKFKLSGSEIEALKKAIKQIDGEP